MNNLTFIEAQTEVVEHGGMIIHVDDCGNLTKWRLKSNGVRVRLFSEDETTDWWPDVSDQKRRVWGVEIGEDVSGWCAYTDQLNLGMLDAYR